jgi:choice-of-anchor A domain-containing protein
MPRARAPRRAHRLSTAVALLAVALAVPAALALTAPASAALLPSVGTGACGVDGTVPGLSTGGPLTTDEGVSVLVGGSYTALPGAKESEGVLAAVGDVRVATDDRFNVGRAGGGSQIVPPAGTAMLVAGGTIDATGSVVDVGHGIVGPDASGGDVVAGGDIRPADAFETNGGALLPGLGDDVAGSLRPLRETLASLAAGLAAQPATGTTVLTDDQLTLTADGPADVHVFDVRAQDLAAARTLLYVGTGASPVVVDVAGADVDYRVLHTALDALSARVDDPSGPAIGPAAARVLWNFADASSLELGDGATTSQLVGSVLVPREDSVVRQRTHTNGRMWVGGDLVVGGAPGLEHHSYPWLGAQELDCSPGTTSPAPAPDPGQPEESPAPADPEGPSEPPAPGEPGAAPEPDETPRPDDVPGGAPAPPSTGAGAVRVDRPVGPVTATGAAAGDRLAATGWSAVLPASAAALLLAGGTTLLVARARRARHARG